MYFVSRHYELLTAIQLLSPLRVSQRDYISLVQQQPARSDRSEIEVALYK